MSHTYKETPVFERANGLMKHKVSIPHVLIAVGGGLLVLKLLPFLLVPMIFMGIGAYFLKQDNQPLDFRQYGGKMSKGHIFIGIGLFSLISTILPGSFIFPLALVAIGAYFLKNK